MTSNTVKMAHELSNFINNLRSVLPLANSHMVHFLTHNMFENILPKPIQEDIMRLDVNELSTLVYNSISNGDLLPFNSKAPNLIEFLSQTQKMSLKESGACFSLEEMCEKLISKGLNECSFDIVKNLMSMKKSHEVEIMSGIIGGLARNENCTHVVDIGGGKGYLSSILSLKYCLKVLSIDSSVTTSQGAEKKIPKVEKLWKTLAKKSLTLSTSSQAQEYQDVEDCSHLCKFATEYISQDTNVKELIGKNFSVCEDNKVMLVGLHTCGNLAASSLRLFINNPDYIKCLVNVGCCYNLMVEEFDTTPSWLEAESEASGFGFPMSKYLKGMKFSLGRTARMLASQPPERISKDRKLDTEILFYRALLEVYLEKKLCHTNGLPVFRVGRLGRKSNNFVDYVHKSIKRLGIDIKVDDKELQQLYDSYAQSRKQLHAFFLLRLVVAPAIEAVIMLDRLLYLQEQGIEDAYVTQLFDPVVSPRCFAIIAINKS